MTTVMTTEDDLAKTLFRHHRVGLNWKQLGMSSELPSLFRATNDEL